MGGKKSSSFLILRFFAGVCFVFLATFAENTVAEEIHALVATSVDLPCTVDTAQCGELHSVKWYRDTSRIYVYSQLGQISRAEGNATKRMSVDYTPNNTEAFLKISKVEIQDEASYKCEITYLEVRENCDVVQIIKLVTLVEPKSAEIYSTMGVPNTSITNTKFGPYDEGTQIKLVCISSGGKPEPIVKWYNGSQEMEADYSTHDAGEGLWTGRSQLGINLSRGDLNARYECKVTSIALKEPMVSWLKMDVQVKPLTMNISFQEDVVAGNDVQFICDVFGANPPAVVKWFKGNDLITNETLIQTFPEAMGDGTYTTKSELTFKPTRFDDNQMFQCAAENSVSINHNDFTFKRQGQLQVKYPPVVTVSPQNITSNETSQKTVFIKCEYEANPMDILSIYWMKDGKNLTLLPNKHEGGTKTFLHLRIKNVTREDMGEYTCTCMNAVGSSISENSAYLNVYFPPEVEVIMDPPHPVKAVNGINVTAVCNVESGNPPSLMKVRWYLGDELLKELPECNYTSNDLDSYGGMYCNVDPIVLSLVTVDQSFAGNYTCQGMNQVGWGLVSEPTELVVHYPPSPAKLAYIPHKVIKAGQVELHCSVDNPGKPENLTYEWKRGGHKLPGESGPTLVIKPVKLDTRNNFTCMAMNEGGTSEPASVFVNVSAPPTFITSLTYQHVRHLQENMSLTCRVECSPLCNISWFKGNEQIQTANNPRFNVRTNIWQANAKTGDFESIESTLVWNVSAWKKHPFAKTTPTANYTCLSSPNGFGNGVSATVVLEVEYPPENLTVSESAIDVTENETPRDVNCSGKGYPYLRYEWRKASTNVSMSKTHILHFKEPAKREDAGEYTCEASNSHGSGQIGMKLVVNYSPECRITEGKITDGEYKGSRALICTVDAKPQVVSFKWTMKKANDTSEEELTTYENGIRGYLILDSDIDTFRTYQCVANNSAGTGKACEIDVSRVASSWMDFFSSDNILILVAIIAGIILCAIFVCIIIIIIICVCRRRRARNKLPNQSTAPDRGRLGGPMNDGSTDPLTNPDKGFYENLPFHGMQTPPNKPYRPEIGDLVYADVDYHYGPINYKGASVDALARKDKNKNKLDDKEYDDLL